jgi:hypothetical protein
MAIQVIGDVHGCADELADLLRACGHVDGDQVVLVGDLVAKGPDSRGVLALVRELSARAVRGNHDQHVLKVRRKLAQGVPESELRQQSLALLRSLDAADLALLEGLPFWLRLPEHAALVVHAGLVPDIPLEAQDPEVLMNVRTLRADGSPSKNPSDGELWGARWPGPELVLFGHHAARGLQQHPFALGLDTGCVYGGRLTACVLPERRIVSVPARRAYAAIRGDA